MWLTLTRCWRRVATRPHVQRQRRPVLRFFLSARASRFELPRRPARVHYREGSPVHPPSTFPNLYETPHTSEKAAGATLTPPALHALLFIREPLLKAAQEFLMDFNFSATAVAQPSKPWNNTQTVKRPPPAPPELPVDSIKLAANNGQSCPSIG